VVALRSCPAALAFSGAYELFQFTMHLLDLPSHGGLGLNVLRGNRTWRITLLALEGLPIGDNPFNVAVLSDYLEEKHEKRNGLQVHQNATGELFICPNDRIEMDVALALFGTDKAVAFERSHEEQPIR